jgi:carbon-monoxide dehydrogenase medium subunit
MVARFLPALADACNSMASYHIRNLATIGGNIVSAVPSADLPPILIVADAKVELQGPRGKRKVKLENFFKGPRKTDMKPGEVMTRIIIPAQPKKSGSSYHKFALRNATALAVAGVAARVEMEKGLIKKAAIALGAVAPIPKPAKRAAAALRRKKPSQEVFEKAAAIAARESKPISDIRGSAEYRRDIVEVLTRRALEDAVARARGKKRK